MSDSHDLASRATDTAAVAKALGLLVAYVDTPRAAEHPPEPAGTVHVVGAPGTGKTHLLHRLDETARALRPPPEAEDPTVVGTVWLSGGGRRPDELYGPLLDALGRDAVVTCLRHHYADVVAGLLGDDPLARSAARLLRPSALAISAQPGYVSRLGVSEPVALDRLVEHLSSVVDDHPCAVALTMLLRTGLDDAAWGWLRGEPPAAVLVERGVDREVRGGVEGVGVLARLFGRPGFRLVVLLDDYDQMVGGRVRDRIRVLLAQLADGGALAVVAGRTRLLDAAEGRTVPPAHHITLFGMSATVGAAFFRELSSADSAAPFEAAAVDRIVALADGNPGLIGALRDRLLGEYGDDAAITEDDVVAGARRFFGTAEREPVVTAIRRVLDSNAWRFRHPRTVVAPQPVQVDFWVYVAGGGPRGGCAIVVDDVVLDDADVARLDALKRAVQAEEPGAPMLLVVAGPINRRCLAPLQDVFDRPPLTFGASSFSEDLTVAVKGMILSLGADGSSDDLGELYRRLDDLGHDQSHLLGIVEQLRETVDRLDARLPAAPAAAGAEWPRETERDELAQVFDRTLSRLGELRGAASTAHRPFDGAGPARGRALDTDTLVRGLGAVEVIRALVENFASAVRAWVQSTRPASAADRHRRELESLCEDYAERLEALPHGLLGDVSHLATATATATARLDQVVREVRELGDEVQAVAGAS